MTERDRCPMCGEEVDWDAQDRLCSWCGMLLTADKTYFFVYRPGRLDTFCSANCVRTAVLTTKTT